MNVCDYVNVTYYPFTIPVLLYRRLFIPIL